MGPANSTSTPQQYAQHLSQYQILQQTSNEGLTYLQHKKTKTQYLLRELSFNDKKQFEKNHQVFKNKLQTLEHKHVVNLKKIFTKSQDQFCSTFYKIYGLFQYPQRSLDDEINQRNLMKRKFMEYQLWGILASCILGMSHLQRNAVRHSSLRSSNILISPEGVIKVCDPITTGLQTNYDTLLNRRSTPHLYLSPQQCDFLTQQSTTPKNNPQKSDIWNLAMIILQSGLLQYQDECYRDDCSRIHWQTLNYNINLFGKNYSQELVNLIEFMLEKDQRARPEWYQLEQHVMKVQQGENIRGSSISQGQLQRGFEGRISSGINQDERDRGLFGESQLKGQNKYGDNYRQSQVNKHSFNNMIQAGSGIRRSTTTNQPKQEQNYPKKEHISSINPFSSITPPSPPKKQAPIPTTTNYSKIQDISLKRTIFNSKLPTLLPSNIEQTRPRKNVFPSNTYVTQTCIDENLIVVPDQEEDEESTENKSYHFDGGNGGGGISNYSAIASSNNGYATGSNVGPPQSVSIGYNFQQIPAQTNSYQPQTRQSPPPPNTFHPPSIPTAQSNYTNPFTSTPTTAIPHKNSQGQYVIQKFKQGSQYEGYKLNGLRHGYGKFHYQDGGLYDGEWRFNKMEGNGKLYYQSGKIAYQGSWKNDQFSGKGILYNQYPIPLNENFDYRDFDEIDEYWTKYEGLFQEDMKSGRGILYLSNGEYFQGDFRNDYAEGAGIFVRANGSRVNGKWNMNRMIS